MTFHQFNIANKLACRLTASTIAIGLVLTGCVTTENDANGGTRIRVSIADALGIKTNTPTSSGSVQVVPTPSPAAVANTPQITLPSIRTTSLAGLFAKAPYDGTPKTYFPKVAVTITDWSRNDCWFATAKIWWSKTKSENVPAFSVCWGTSLGFSINNAANLHLFMEQNAIEHTGNVRSLGPKPPMIAVPDHPPIASNQQNSYSGFIEELVMDTGWQAGAPTNFWLVNFNSVDSATLGTNKIQPQKAVNPIQNTVVAAQANGANSNDFTLCKSSEWTNLESAIKQKNNKVTPDNVTGDSFGATYKLSTPLSIYGQTSTEIYYYSEGGEVTAEARFYSKNPNEKYVLLQKVVQSANLKANPDKTYSRTTDNGTINAGFTKKGAVYISCSM